MARAALKCFHELLLVSTLNPLDSAPCQQLLEAAKQSKPPIHKKDPVTPDMCKQVIEKHGSSSASLKDFRLAAICCIGFAGFFRYNELSQMSPTHLECFPDYLTIFVPKAKNDVCREGSYVYVQRLNNQYCAVTTLERYIKLGEIETTSTDYNLFRQVRFFKKKNTYKLCGKGLSYSKCREIFTGCLKGLGYDEKKFGLHSLRSGGATAAVINNRNLSERLLKLHGRWKSDIAKDMYILEETQNRLSVTCNLGLKV